MANAQTPTAKASQDLNLRFGFRDFFGVWTFGAWDFNRLSGSNHAPM
jgi:hypothetical protein